ncbi:hypothetical protein [Maridesulfovibrio sp.]|uniref:hypothetical protein n=1 Tax=Maridesulfovibrio sp. TaxID=2795000 RepID=UPI002A187F2E|nr:hypothetical protein [Maridesulfovibrio sp.]
MKIITDFVEPVPHDGSIGTACMPGMAHKKEMKRGEEKEIRLRQTGPLNDIKFADR